MCVWLTWPKKCSHKKQNGHTVQHTECNDPRFLEKVVYKFTRKIWKGREVKHAVLKKVENLIQTFMLITYLFSVQYPRNSLVSTALIHICRDYLTIHRRQADCQSIEFDYQSIVRTPWRRTFVGTAAKGLFENEYVKLCRVGGKEYIFYCKRAILFFSSSKMLTPHPPLRPASLSFPRNTLAGRRGGWGANILEDDRNRIALLQ